VQQDFARPTLPRRAHFPFENVWLGVSVEDRKYGLPRIEHLRRVPAAVRFLSIEPLLEDLGEIDLTGIGWVIVGGESGPGARPFDLAWARSIRDQCRAAGVPFFLKQVGSNPFDSLFAFRAFQGGRAPLNRDHAMALGALTLDDKKGGNLSELPSDLRIREMPARAT
jgi:protein gp37